MYLPSFYKVQFEKYIFNTKWAGMFAIPVVLWRNIYFYRSGMVFLPQLLQLPLHWLLPPCERSLKKTPGRMILFIELTLVSNLLQKNVLWNCTAKTLNL